MTLEGFLGSGVVKPNDYIGFGGPVSYRYIRESIINDLVTYHVVVTGGRYRTNGLGQNLNPHTRDLP